MRKFISIVAALMLVSAVLVSCKSRGQKDCCKDGDADCCKTEVADCCAN
ncbi:MAG: hypothetical protein II054_04645 [Treponema sp.]|jgi:hypothetical protein|nr:hypothetical protein [Treponema sp.]MBQ1661767.1 hypothetical protein [Treponema sp.]MBQ2081154.1 hypothetical protein [Treponema sp.]MBR6294986.1 hypothetical protein [Treponema sp.]MEE3314165.1 hypothetical protein [Treponema sp.]